MRFLLLNTLILGFGKPSTSDCFYSQIRGCSVYSQLAAAMQVTIIKCTKATYI